MRTKTVSNAVLTIQEQQPTTAEYNKVKEEYTKKFKNK